MKSYNYGIIKAFSALFVIFAASADLRAEEKSTNAAVIARFPLEDVAFKEPQYEKYRNEVPLKFRRAWGEFFGAYGANLKSFRKGEEETESLFKMAFAYDALKRILDYTIEKRTGAAPELTIDHDIIKTTLKEKTGTVEDKKGECARFAETSLYYKKPKKLKGTGWITANIMWRKFNNCVKDNEKEKK